MAGLKVFVTRELYPFTSGGIGRAIANLLDTHAGADLGREFAVVYLGMPLDEARFRTRYPGVMLVDASPLSYVESDSEGFHYTPADQFSTHPLHAESIRAMQALKRLASEQGPLEYVEFSDWGAVAFASLQEKRLGLAFLNTTLAIRLHTSDSVLSATESKPVDQPSLILFDLERKALADCDLLIGQVPATARWMQRFFDFSDPEWLPRLRIRPPPVNLEHGALAAASIVPNANTPIVFSSKIQRIKRPDVFVRGCCEFVKSNPAYIGKIVLAAVAEDVNYLEEIKRLVPPDLAERFSFLQEATPEERAKVIGVSVCVFPGSFESFCLAAFEASMAGALCILNASNPAFSRDSAWADAINCVKFDGSASGLSGALTRAFTTTQSLRPVSLDLSAPPSWQSPPPAGPANVDDGAAPLVSVLIAHYNLGSYLNETVRSVLASDYTPLEVVIVDDASTDPASIDVIAGWESGGDPRVRIVRLGNNVGLAGARNVAASHARGEFALTLDADDLIEPRFIGIGAKALVRHPEVSFVVPQTAYFDDGPSVVGLPRYMTFVGEARVSGFFINRFSTATMMTRTALLRSLRYDESLRAYEDWDLYMRAAMQRHRFVVTNAVHFHYRRRHDSMIHNESAIKRMSIFYHDVLRGKELTVGDNQLPLYLLEGAVSGIGHGESVDHLRARLANYDNSTLVQAALAVRARLNSLPDWMHSPLRRLVNVIRSMRAIRRGV
ncbi:MULTISPECIES: glycosyltransferase [unclassified Caballeronia]|uniref:glycosyltransferase n=1 Tax=unclassified Caballeronia TaxID=2646786 RepID=UPI002028A423|nr:MULTISPECIES: glycosyltransferase [unclassified Caballeronia]